MARRVRVYSYQVQLVPDPDGGYTVLVPALPGCVSYGETVEEATRNAKEAIQLYIEVLRAKKEPVPVESEREPILTTFVQVCA
jgi:antitoxin HicB